MGRGFPAVAIAVLTVFAASCDDDSPETCRCGLDWNDDDYGQFWSELVTAPDGALVSEQAPVTYDNGHGPELLSVESAGPGPGDGDFSATVAFTDPDGDATAAVFAFPHEPAYLSVPIPAGHADPGQQRLSVMFHKERGNGREESGLTFDVAIRDGAGNVSGYTQWNPSDPSDP